MKRLFQIAGVLVLAGLMSLVVLKLTTNNQEPAISVQEPAGFSKTVHPNDIDALVKVIGCPNFKKEDNANWIAKEGGRCLVNGQEIHVLTFADSKSQYDWFGIARDNNTDSYYVLGDLWVVQSDSAAAIKTVYAKTGGIPK